MWYFCSISWIGWNGSSSRVILQLEWLVKGQLGNWMPDKLGKNCIERYFLKSNNMKLFSHLCECKGWHCWSKDLSWEKFGLGFQLQVSFIFVSSNPSRYLRDGENRSSSQESWVSSSFWSDNLSNITLVTNFTNVSFSLQKCICYRLLSSLIVLFQIQFMQPKT